MVDGDGQAVRVGHPEITEEQFGLRAGVVEDQRDAVTAHLFQHRADGITPAAARPRGGGIGFEHCDVRVRAGIGQKDRAGIGVAGEEARDGGGILNRRGQPDAAQAGSEGLEPGQRQHQLVAALGFCQRVNFVQHHARQPREHARRVFVGQQQRERFRRGQQDVRRIGALAAALGVARVAGPILDPDRQRHVGDGCRQVAPDVGGKRLERRDVESVQPRMPIGAFNERGQKPRQGLAATRGRDQEERGQARTVHHVLLMRMHGPAARGKPVGKAGGKGGHRRSIARRCGAS